MSDLPGGLYLVGTPIGNLEDITQRALRVLAEVDLIAAEDTRVTRRLLSRYHISARLLSYHEHSPPRRLAQLLDLLRAGQRVALVSDAGMPGLSDPGAQLVRAAAEAGLPVYVVPGPSAAAAAVALSGFTARQHLFLGFPPPRQAARRRALRAAAAHPGLIIMFEAPHRIRDTLADLLEVLGDREALCARELTKRFEEVLRGRLSELVAHFAEREPRGEFTLVIAPAPAIEAEPDLAEAVAEVEELAAAGLPPSRAVAHVARRRGLPRRDLYRAARVEGTHEG